MSSRKDSEVIRSARGAAEGGLWTLTGLDRANLIFVLRGTWVFEGPLDPERLKASLAELLAAYPHLSGRMVKGKVISLNDRGVPFTVLSKTDASLESLEVESFTCPIGKGRMKRGREAVMAVRVTRLQGSTWVLGVSCSHACLDGAGFYGMVADWGRLSRGLPLEPAPLLDQSLIPSGEGGTKAEVIREALEAGWRKPGAGTFVGVVGTLIRGGHFDKAAPICFSPEALAELKRAAAAEAGLDRVSTNVALSAHLSTLGARLMGHPRGTRCCQITVVDGRERLPTVPRRFVGNAAFTPVTATFDAGASLGEVAAAIHQGLEPLLSSPSAALEAQVRLGQRLLHHRAFMTPYEISEMISRRPRAFYINNFSKQPIYEADFGAEGSPSRPTVVFPHRLGDQVMIWPAPPTRGGVEVYLMGALARAAEALDEADPLWRELHLA